MKVGMIALTAALLMLAWPAWAGPGDPCDGTPDTDGDTVCDAQDNCIDIPNNPPGCDTDCDGYGNMCDGDFNSDMFVNGIDFGLFFPDFLADSDSGIGSDMNCDTFVNGIDFGLFFPQFLQGVPGASGLSCAGTADCCVHQGNE
jgi:hypothetical protein